MKKAGAQGCVILEPPLEVTRAWLIVDSGERWQALAALLAVCMDAQSLFADQLSMTVVEPAAASKTGWSAGATRHFLLAGRPWGAVENYYREVVSAKQRNLLGLCLLDAPAAEAAAAAEQGQGSGQGSHPAAEPAGDCAAERDRLVEDQQQQQQQQQQQPQQQEQYLGLSLVQAQPATAGTAKPGRRTRTTFKVHLSYYGPAFRQA